MNVRLGHKHKTTTTRAIRQRSGIPYEVEQKICRECRELLDEKRLRRATAA